MLQVSCGCRKTSPASSFCINRDGHIVVTVCPCRTTCTPSLAGCSRFCRSPLKCEEFLFSTFFFSIKSLLSSNKHQTWEYLRLTVLLYPENKNVESGILEVLIFSECLFLSNCTTGPENNKLSGKAKRREEGNKNSQESLSSFCSPDCWELWQTRDFRASAHF